MNERAVKGTLGLAMRAGCLTTGVELAVGEIRAGKSKLILVDEAASDNSKKRLSDACAYYKAQAYTLPAGLLDEAAGKSGRMAAAVKAGGFAKKLSELLSRPE